ncbi:MAG: triose-phosphate isomerase [Tissierellia bacterium]|nr:triose-phosphate isomerase [Tissierellia bacterium]
MRKPLIAGNWKMNFTTSEAVEFVEQLVQASYDENVEKLICVPAVHLSELYKYTKTAGFELGAQNMYYEEKGAFTGEISPLMLKDLNVDYVILGHSERREIFKEDDHMINKKVLSAFAHGIKPILCCGETLVEREADLHKDKIKTQIETDLEGVTAEQCAEMVIAYEPIWAIGTGRTASSSDAYEIIAFIRELIKDKYGDEVANKIRILYGGSVNPENIGEFMEIEEIDGALVGGASLDVMSFNALVNF